MFGAVILDQLAKQLTPEILTMIPVEYRLFAFNILEVLLVETAKRLKRGE